MFCADVTVMPNRAGVVFVLQNLGNPVLAVGARSERPLQAGAAACGRDGHRFAAGDVGAGG